MQGGGMGENSIHGYRIGNGILPVGRAYRETAVLRISGGLIA
jgi:hypothetical protein